MLSPGWVLTVTAGTTDRWFAGILTLGNGITITGWSTFPADADHNLRLNNLTLVYDRTVSACNYSRLLSELLASLTSGGNNTIIVCDKGNVRVQITCILATKNYLSGAILVYDDLDMFELRRMPCPYIAINLKEASILMRYVVESSSTYQYYCNHEIPTRLCT